MRRSHITREELQQARVMFRERVEQLDPDGRASLFLSGGIDSTTVLFALLDSGRKPHCLSFQLQGRSSPDARSAQRLCRHFGVPWRLVEVPTDRAILEQDVKRVLRLVNWKQAGKVKKTIVQCVHPFLYLYPALGNDLALNGLGGDSYFATTAQEQKLLHTGAAGQREVEQDRYSYAGDPTYSDYHIMAYGRSLGIQNHDFYDFPGMAAYIDQYTVQATHSPVTKYATVGIYRDYWRQGAFLREPSSFQVNSGTRELHDTLLPGSGHRAIIGLYNRWAKELGVAP